MLLLRKYAASAHAAVLDVGFAEFVSNDILCDAVIKRLELTGEAARRLPVPVPRELSAIPVGQLIGMRNILAHRYERADLDMVYRAALEDMPVLVCAIDEWCKANGIPAE